jgi:hypothetical protein
MPTWLRGCLAVIASFVAWFGVATAGNFVVRWLIPGYTEVERAMDFSFGMLVARLVLAAVTSVAAGAVCAAISRHSRLAAYIFALLLLALFVPVHASLWHKFPIWYHIIFLGTLVPLILLGARLPGLRKTGAA